MGSAAAIPRTVGHDIPSLDGLRAVSIAIVVLSHTKFLLPAIVVNSGLFRYLIGGGLHGVQVFFVISGYLITTLLVREFERTGDVSLRTFYARRTLRIFPPFYVYLIVVAGLWAAGVRQDSSTFLAAATYTIIYHPHPQGWLLQHTWSLSIEEQFYLLWPAVLLAGLRRNWTVRFAVIVLATMPIFRFLFLLASGQQPDHSRLIVNCSAIDMLMIGCLLALTAKDSQWASWRNRWITAWSTGLLAVVGLLLVPYAEVKLSGTSFGYLAGAFGYTVTALSIGTILEYLVKAPQSVVGRILNLGVVRHLGVISYSIYLWQQLFTSNLVRFGVFTYVFILVAAEASFWLIERPLMRVRARFDSACHYRSSSAELTSSATRVSVSAVSPKASIQ